MRHKTRAIWGAGHKHRACGDQNTPPCAHTLNSMPAATIQKKHKALNPPLLPEADLPGNLSMTCPLVYILMWHVLYTRVCNTFADRGTVCWELSKVWRTEPGEREPHEASAGHWSSTRFQVSGPTMSDPQRPNSMSTPAGPSFLRTTPRLALTASHTRKPGFNQSLLSARVL